MKPYLTPSDVAKWLMVSPVTVRVWAQKGLLRAETTVGGHRRYLRPEVERFAAVHGMTLLPTSRAESRILVVDDDVQLAGYLRELLSGLPQVVVVELAHDGFEAGQKIIGFEPDIVLLDLRMPGLDGFEVCKRIKSDPRTRAVRVLAMTGYAGLDAEKQIVALGAECCLQKPMENSALLTALKLGKSAYTGAD